MNHEYLAMRLALIIEHAQRAERALADLRSMAFAHELDMLAASLRAIDDALDAAPSRRLVCQNTLDRA